MSHIHPWCQRLLTAIPEERSREPVPPDNGKWDYVETELVKLGSLAHSQVDLDAVAESCLQLFELHTKDMRVLAQLLRCLQQPAKLAPFATALDLLEAWLGAYWLTAWPHNLAQKQRLMTQIVKRFEAAAERSCESASAAELSQLLGRWDRLSSRWLALCPDKEETLASLGSALRRAQSQQAAQQQAEGGQRAQTAPSGASSATAMGLTATPSPAAPLEIDSSNDRAWRQTQLKVAELLIERQSEAAVGYRLRRHAIWSGIATPPLAGANGKTQLAPVSADMVDEYRAAMGQPTQALWQKVEQSLTLAPYWLEGHQLSFELARALGFNEAAQGIREEAQAFLARLPGLKALSFSDGTPFLPAVCASWLQQARAGEGGAELGSLAQLDLDEGGLALALQRLEEQMQGLSEPRSRFYAELVQADLLAQAGMGSLARQHYQHLWQTTVRLGLAQWEPSLVNRLEQHATPGSK
ncbi:type VI secretion system protein VasJ [Aeromonas sp. BIGb0405]|uniref:type VI secretion system protein TssA n=1 Tax=Aeromonas sp. BIGb0405 TaxID=2940592 RepID=UPI0021692A01|nr:type VI secretion system protein TssA [Aeromonas sp. BIGb0405]MCS3455793.1 type VI secretion system protein VasJ [Aeromonas sp. BIGb0405]